MQSFEQLKERHRVVRDRFPPNLNVRLHRALSWFQRANLAEDEDGQLIFLWIAFNAAYATELRHDVFPSEQEAFRHFLTKICAMDDQGQIDALLWKEFSGSIRVLLDNPYVFRSFWDYQSDRIDEATWQRNFEKGKARAKRALASGKNEELLYVIFDRIYTLRNQLVHGGATWNSSVNRAQVRDSARLMAHIVPIFLELMLDHPEQPWGDPSFPVVKD